MCEGCAELLCVCGGGGGGGGVKSEGVKSEGVL